MENMNLGSNMRHRDDSPSNDFDLRLGLVRPSLGKHAGALTSRNTCDFGSFMSGPGKSWRTRCGRMVSVNSIFNSGDQIKLENETLNGNQRSCKRKASHLVSRALSENRNRDSGEMNFDCNICLNMAKEPVLTECGHLFCWPCLYHWLHIYSDSRECPFCEFPVTETNLIPIYGQGSEEDNKYRDHKFRPIVPPRPNARRTENLRERTNGSLPIEDLIQAVRNRFETIRGQHLQSNLDIGDAHNVLDETIQPNDPLQSVLTSYIRPQWQPRLRRLERERFSSPLLSVEVSNDEFVRQLIIDLSNVNEQGFSDNNELSDMVRSIDDANNLHGLFNLDPDFRSSETR